jgi:hypothetical protein
VNWHRESLLRRKATRVLQNLSSPGETANLAKLPCAKDTHSDPLSVTQANGVLGVPFTKSLKPTEARQLRPMVGVLVKPSRTRVGPRTELLNSSGEILTLIIEYYPK